MTKDIWTIILWLIATWGISCFVWWVLGLDLIYKKHRK